MQLGMRLEGRSWVCPKGMTVIVATCRSHNSLRLSVVEMFLLATWNWPLQSVWF